MERLRTLTTIAWMLAAMILVELAFLVHQIGSPTRIMWITLFVLFFSCVYLVRLAIGALRELKEKEKDKK